MAVDQAPPRWQDGRESRYRGEARRSSRSVLRRRYARLGWGFAAPALLVILAVTVFPIVFSVVMSLSNVSVSGNGFDLGSPTTHNYALLLGSGRWRHALVFTVVYTVITVLAEVVLGTVIALVLERLSVGRGWMMAILLLPWALITVISAELWNYMYNGVYGILNIFGSPVLGKPLSAAIAIGVADVWKTTPFVAIIVLAGLVMLPTDITEAGRVDGASGWTIFWRIRLPLLRPTLAVAVLFRVLQAFGVFDLIFVMTGGGPGSATESLAVLGWKIMFSNLQFGPGAAVATSTAVLVLAGCLLFLKAFRTQVGKEDVSL